MFPATRTSPGPSPDAVSAALYLRGELAKSSGAFFFIWTIITLGVTVLFSAILSARGLWSLRRGQAPYSEDPNMDGPAAPRGGTAPAGSAGERRASTSY